MAKQYHITDFGASVHASDNTTAIQAAIDSCFREGGGAVVVPAGVFLTGDIRLRSHVTLYLTANAVRADYNPRFNITRLHFFTQF